MSAARPSFLCNADCSLAGGCSAAPREECAAYTSLCSAMHCYFGFDSFKPGQLEAILPVLHGRDTFVRMATGGGKSLCMYLAPLACSSSAIALVISPLVGIMNEQVEWLLQAGVTAVRASAAGDYESVVRGDYQIVFMSPESAVNYPWRNVFKVPHFKQHLVLVAVDEAHLICEWGPQFRTAFEKIGGLRALTKVPFMALTASAPSAVEDKIITSLGLHNPIKVKHDLNRPNIYIIISQGRVISKDLANLADRLCSCQQPLQFPKTVIFVKTKSVAVKIMSFLKCHAHQKGMVSMYHAKLSIETKKHIHQQFSSNTSKLRCLCATVAFGLGMDIRDIELIVVYGLPATMAMLYQMFGRAGRGGVDAVGQLIYTCKEMRTANSELADFISNKENCRRHTLMQNLGCTDVTVADRTLCCDVCSSCTVPYARLRFLMNKPHVRRTRAQKRRIVRTATPQLLDELHSKLLSERDNITSNNPGFSYLGADIVCPLSVICNLCERAKSVQTIDDVKVPGLRPQLYEKIFNIICNILPAK